MARPKSTGEKRTERLSLLMTPQLLADVTTLAQIKKVSLNDFFLTLAAQVINKNRPAIDEVQGVMNKVSETVDISLFDE